MKSATSILIASIFFTCIFGFSHQTNWIEFKTSEFAIMFPQKPDTSSQLVPSKIGSLKMEIIMYDASKAKDDNLMYCVMTAVYPDSLVNSDKKENLPTFFRASIDGAVKNVGGKLLSEQDIEVSGFPGREFRTGIQQGRVVLKMRFFLVHNKLFMLEVGSHAAKEKNISASSFLRSFVLFKK